MKDDLHTEEDLAKVSEHRFYFRMSLRERIRIRNNMRQMRKKHGIYMTEVFRKVMLTMIKDEEFLKNFKNKQ